MSETQNQNTTRELTGIAMRIDELVNQDDTWPSNTEEALEYLDVLTDE